MQSESLALAGEYSSIGGRLPFDLSRCRYSRIVENGLRQGNHKSPSPFKYTISDYWTTGQYVKILKKPSFEVSSAVEGRVFAISHGGKRSDEDYGFCIGFPRAPWGELENRAFAKIYAQIRGDYNVMVDLAEMGSTIRMLRGATALTKFTGEFFRRTATSYRGPTRGQRWLDYVTGKWLEYTYGWKPLVNSIYEGFDALIGWQSDEIRRFRGTAATKLDATAFSNNVSNGQYYTRATRSGKVSHRVLVEANFYVPRSGFMDDAVSLNPVTIGYELMTLSFVVDWFIDIGGYLQLMEHYLRQRSKFKGGYVTRSSKADITSKLEGDTFQASTGWGGALSGGDYHHRYRHLDRRVLTALPIPALPTFDVRMGAARMMSAASLFQQLVAKKLRH